MKVRVVLMNSIEMEVDDKFAPLGDNHPNYHEASPALFDELCRVLETTIGKKVGEAYDSEEERDNALLKGIIYEVDHAEFGSLISCG